MYLHCGCRTYLSTYICNAAHGQHKDDDNVLAKTKFLPDKPPRAPPKCKVKTATSPSSASCPRCDREKRKAGASAAAQPARATPVPAALQGKILLDLKLLPGDGGEGEQELWV